MRMVETADLAARLTRLECAPSKDDYESLSK
jgi:hypothetical protein